MFKLDDRTPLVKKGKRVGRGGSRGGTSGKGHKGQKARSGAGRKVKVQFEGGQMPLHRRLPKRGFTNSRFKVTYDLVNVADLETLTVENNEVTKAILATSGLIKSEKSKVKLLGDGTFTKAYKITVDACSKSALKKVQDCGGEVVTLAKRV